MKIGFDYWNVISHYPSEFRELLGAFENYVDDVYIISAIGKTRLNTVANEIRKLPGWEKLSDNFYKERVHEVIFESPKESPRKKLEKCKELGIQMFFDDRQDVCDLLNENGILAFKVPRKNKKSDIGAEQA